MEDTFRFKEFEVVQAKTPMKVGTDGVLLGAWVALDNVTTGLDIGTGTGLVALMCAQRKDDLSFVGIDIDEEAVTEAATNFGGCQWNGRLEAHHISLQDFASDQDNVKSFDLIVCNPPFFSGGTLSESMGKTNARHTAKLSHGDLLRSVQKLLSSEGRFGVVLPDLEGLRFQEMAVSYGLVLTRLLEVRSRKGKGVERRLMEFKYLHSAEKPIKEELILYKDRGREPTDEYVALTADYYLDL